MTVFLRIAVACVRGWTWLYTSGLPPAARSARRAEIDSDLWESLTAQEGDAGVEAVLLFLRLLLGIPDDVGWRMEQDAIFGSVPRRSLTLGGQAIGAAFLMCATGVIHVDANRKPSFEPIVRVVHRRGEGAQPAAATVRFDEDVHPSGRSHVERADRAASVSAPTFEAASVKPNTSGLPNGQDQILPGGRYRDTNLSLLFLIRFAYDPSPHSRGLAPFDVVGGPSWIGSDRFDVTATAGHDASLSEMRLMLQALLAERFHVQTHFDARQMPVYRMVLAQPGALGAQLHRTEADCTREPFDPFRGITSGESYRCGYFGPSPNVKMDTGRAYQAIRGMTIEEFALRLHEYLGRRVIDATGLPGYFDADFEFTTEIVMPPPPPGQPNPYDGRVLPSIFSVLPQQLGLKLESQRGPSDILVIDHADHPTPD
jgi:uncharacterized protein (TIGR03435 family)